MKPFPAVKWVLALVFCAPIGALATNVDLPGLSNFQKVDDGVYRGAQPTGDGFTSLAKLGVKTVVDLRLIGERSQADERRAVEAAGMRYLSVPMAGMATPEDDEISRVLAVLDDSTAGPAFVHCQRGADRTGAVIGCYRINHDHWQNRQALTEARSVGMSWYQRALQSYVLHYQPSATPNLSALASHVDMAH